MICIHRDYTPYGGRRLLEMMMMMMFRQMVYGIYEGWDYINNLIGHMISNHEKAKLRRAMKRPI